MTYQILCHKIKHFKYETLIHLWMFKNFKRMTIIKLDMTNKYYITPH